MKTAFFSIALTAAALIAPATATSSTQTTFPAAVVLLTPTTFQAVNPTLEDRVLAFYYESSEPVALVPLLAGEELLLSVPEGATEGLRMEVVTFDESGNLLSTEVSMDLGQLTAGDPLLIAADDQDSRRWRVPNPELPDAGDNATPVEPDPVEANGVLFVNPSVALAHVPVVLPHDHSGQPPVIEDPLPLF